MESRWKFQWFSTFESSQSSQTDYVLICCVCFLVSFVGLCLATRKKGFLGWIMERSSRTSEEVCLRTHHLNGTLLESYRRKRWMMGSCTSLFPLSILILLVRLAFCENYLPKFGICSLIVAVRVAGQRKWIVPGATRSALRLFIIGKTT